MYKTNYFEYKKEEGQNPYTGFMSYQHFEGDPLYSDCVVIPENKGCETEHYECYPVPENVNEKGREEGFYPKTTIAYIRVLWKEWEPKQGEYNYKFLEDIIKKAKDKGQTLIFRLMPHSTRSSDDVPEWLKGIIDCPERPDGMRVKDSPTDPLFIELFSRAVIKLGEKFDSDPTFACIDISLPGAWGEGHKLENYPEKDLKKLINAYIDTFKNTRLIGQVAKPELILDASRNARVGIRGDGFGNPWHIDTWYPEVFGKIPDLWKTAHVSFESYWWLGEWKRKGWDIDKIIKKSLEWHVSSFNGKYLPIPNEWKSKIDEWLSKMGYHFAIDYFKFPELATKGENIELELAVDNVGVAPLYDNVPLYIRLCGEKEYEIKTDTDVTKWLPGKHKEEIKFLIPKGAESGEYDIEIGIFGDNYPLVYFATDAERNEKFYKVGKMTIV